MKRFVVVLILAIVFVLIALYFIKPEIVEKIWLWIVGLLGAIILFLQKSTKWLGDQFGDLFNKKSDTPSAEEEVKKTFFMQVFRYSRSGNRVFGLVFIEGEFAGISSENTVNGLGVYDLGIKDNRVIFSKEDFRSSIVPLGQAAGAEKDILFSTDKNFQTISPDIAFNAIIEKLANQLEKESEPKLLICNQGAFNETKN